MYCPTSVLLVLLSACLTPLLAKTHRFNWNIGYVDANPDGVFPRRMIGINGEWPNPIVRVKRNDRVVINFHNGLPDRNSSLHFHGLFMKGQNGQDGPEMVTQCPIGPSVNFTYDFTIGNQTGTYWYHSHSGSQYGDGLRGMFVIEEDDEESVPYVYDEEVALSVSEHYHLETPVIMKSFMSRFNPTGAEPIPQNSLFNETKNATWNVVPDRTYLLRVVNMGLFVSQYLFIEDHDLVIVEVDGVPVQPYTVDSLYITVGQRYAVLVKTKPGANRNYRFANVLDMTMLDEVPEDLQLVSTNYVVYNDNVDNPGHYPYHDFDETVGQLKGFNDFELVPLSGERLLPEPDMTIQVNFSMEVLGDGVTYALFNGKSYTPPKVPTLYTVLSSGELAANQEIYGTNTNAYVLHGGEVIELVLNNQDDGKHPFHLHGHNFQVIARSENDPEEPVVYVPDHRGSLQFPKVPVIRDTIEVRPNGYFVLRFVAENPGVWFFHCHVDWHLEQGLALVLVEDPHEIQKLQGNISDNHAKACKEVQVPTQGNAAGHMSFLDLRGQNLQQPPLPNGFTGKGYLAMAVCTSIALYGLGSIYNYGIEDVSQDNSAAVFETLRAILNEHDGE
ncbi:uncharacterized protein LODBEIA_P38970 [Lodderomyces beijingensis]|uniref:Iron transport multicopper oxidase FET3 n=1 Tax=Lodderomyces beijingensis TaxID=1775926 RepID=A0ABP0ZNE1_9ASCO